MKARINLDWGIPQCTICGCQNSNRMYLCSGCRRIYCGCFGEKISYKWCITLHQDRGLCRNGRAHFAFPNLWKSQFEYPCPRIRIIKWGLKFKCPMNWLLKGGWIYAKNKSEFGRT